MSRSPASVTRALDLGCGERASNPFCADEVYGVDVVFPSDCGAKEVKLADLAVEPIPFGNDFFDFLTAFDFLEHIPRVIYCPHRKNSFVDLMSEVYRVLKPGGLFLSFTPGYPSEAAFVDPTHVNFITLDTLPMNFGERRLASIYGYTGGAFQVVKNEWHDWISPPKLVKPGLKNPGKTHIITILKK